MNINNMKVKIVRFFLLTLVVASVSCTKNDETTIIPVGTESYIDDIFSVIPDSTMQAFEEAFGNVPQGYVPANIEGDYVIAPKQRVASNVAGWPLNPSDPEPNVSLRFSEQQNGVVRVELTEALEQVTDTAFVMGSGNDFTVYFIENKAYEVSFVQTSFHVDMKRGIVIKGSIDAEGIRNLYFAVVVMEVSDDSNGLIPQYEPGSYFIYKDGNGMASRLDVEGGEQ